MNSFPFQSVLFAAALTLPASATAQFRDPPPPAAYALQNVTVVHADGRREPGITLVIRNGLISAWGPGVAIPGDAQVLEGDSLHVYPGMIDAQGAAEVEFPEIERGEDVRPWNAPRDVQGFLPHRRVADYLAPTDGADQRKAGVVAAGIHPEDAMAGGRGLAMLYRKDAGRAWDLIVNEDVGLSMEFDGARGAYPGTLFGVIAYLRQAFEDARRDGQIRQAFARNAEGMTVPSADPDYAVLRRAMAGELPVFFTASDAEDIRRVLSLADEYGFRPVIVGGWEAWRVTGELSRRDVPVLIDGDFPEPEEWEPEDEEREEGEEMEADTAEVAEPQEPEPLAAAAAREKERLENIYANAGRLEAAGVTFAITTGGGDADLRAAVRKSIEYGLSEAAALRAVTTTPAQLLGVSNLPRLGRGLPATFLAVDGPLFGEETEIVYAFVEGRYEEGGSGGGGGAPAADVTGDWTLTMESGGQEFVFTATITMEENGRFSGTARNDQLGSAPIRGRVAGNSITFTMSINAGGQAADLRGEGTVEGDTMSGSGESPFGSFSFSGTKTPGGAR